MDDELRSMLVKIMESQTEMKQSQAKMKQSQDGMQQSQDGLKEDIKIIYAKLEGEFTNKIDTLLDGYKQNYEMISEVKELVKKNTEDIVQINMSLSWMKEDINLIAGKTVRHDIKIDKINEKLKAVK